MAATAAREWRRSRRGIKSRVAPLVLIAASLAPRGALAQRVLLLRPSESDRTLFEAFSRLRAELKLQDFEVIVRDATTELSSPETLEREAQGASAFAGISLSRQAASATADVCIADRVTGKISERRLAIATSDDAPGVLAVRAVDLLRASLRELGPGEHPAPDVIGVAPEPPPAQIGAFSELHRHWQLRATAAALGSGADLGVGLGVGVSLFYRPTPRWAVGLALAGPLAGARYAAPNGAATLRQEIALLRGYLNLLPGGSFTFGPSLAGGLYHLRAQGEVDPPLTGRAADVFSLAAGGGLDAGARLSENLTLDAALDALVLAPRPAVAVDVSQRAIGQPVLNASLGLGVAF